MMGRNFIVKKCGGVVQLVEVPGYVRLPMR